MPAKLDILEPGCCCVSRAPVYPEIHLMENSVIVCLLSLLSATLAYSDNTLATTISCFTTVYGLLLVVHSYRDVQRKYYERLEREEIETEGVSEASDTTDTASDLPDLVMLDTTDSDDDYSDIPELIMLESDDDYSDMPSLIMVDTTGSDDGDDAKSDYSDLPPIISFDNTELTPPRRRRVIKVKNPSGIVEELTQDARVLKQLRQIEKEVAERNAASVTAAASAAVAAAVTAAATAVDAATAADAAAIDVAAAVAAMIDTVENKKD